MIMFQMVSMKPFFDFISLYCKAYTKRLLPIFLLGMTEGYNVPIPVDFFYYVLLGGGCLLHFFPIKSDGNWLFFPFPEQQSMITDILHHTVVVLIPKSLGNREAQEPQGHHPMTRSRSHHFMSGMQAGVTWDLQNFPAEDDRKKEKCIGKIHIKMAKMILS